MDYSKLSFDETILKKKDFFKASEARNIMRQTITSEEKKELKTIIEFECNNGNTDTIMYKSYNKNAAKKLFLEDYGYFVKLYENNLIINWSSEKPEEFDISKIKKND
jgi:hypothetical protein